MDNLANASKVTEYLKELGYKVAKSTVYQHRKEGWLPTQADGTFLVRDVEKYASLHLKRLDGSSNAADMEQLQREKLVADTLKSKAQAKHWDIKTAVEEGHYIEKDLFYGELAARASILKNDLESFFRSNAEEMITLAGGDTLKAPELIDFGLKRLDIFLGRYSRPHIFKTGRKV